MRWSHRDGLSRSDGGALVERGDGGWIARPFPGDDLPLGPYADRETAMAAAEAIVVGTHCCSDTDFCPQPGPEMTEDFKKTIADVDVESLETPFKGYFRIDKYRLRHRKYEGGWTETIQRELFERGHAVGILPYDPKADRLVLVEQFRIGAFAAINNSPWFKDDASPWLIECIAGIIDKGESPQQVAIREAVEEAGCQVTDVRQVCQYFATPGGSTESLFIYLARTDSSGIGGVHGLDHEGEDIRVLTPTAAEVFEWIDQGRIVNAMTLVALQWFRLNYQAVRSEWTAGDATST